MVFDEEAFPYLAILNARLREKFPYFAKVIGKRVADFGDSWVVDFEEELATFFRTIPPDLGLLLPATDGSPSMR